MAAPPLSRAVDASDRTAERGFRHALETIVDSFAVRSATSFTILGDTYDAGSPGDGDADLTDAARALLAHVLYSALHCRYQAAVSAAIIEPRAREADRPSFLASLAEANRGTGAWHEGWRIVASEADGMLRVEQGGLVLWARQADFRGDSALTPGSGGRLRFPKEYLSLYPGYYVALGNAHDGHRENTIRLYWNVRAEGAVVLVDELSRRFNDASVGFLLKILSSPDAYQRADGAIVYVARDAWDGVREIVAAAHSAVASWLRPDVSMFALRLAPGLALAEDPIEHVSFGQHRSGLVASALIASVGAGDRSVAVLQFLAAAGLDVERFYLNPGSTSAYRAL